MADKRVLSQINVTPFVDVMLVLLIIFMVTAPMMQAGIDIDLPKVETSNIKTDKEPIVLSVNKKGELFIQDKVIPTAELENKLTAIFKNRAEKMVLLRADEDVPYGKVIGAMAAVRKAGIEKLGMVTDPEWSGK